MTIFVSMRGELDPVELEGDFLAMAQQLNLASARGMQYVVCEEPNGQPIMLAINNINVIREGQDGDAYSV